MADLGQKLVIGVDIGGTNTSAGLMDHDLKLIDSIERPTQTGSQALLLQELSEILHALAGRAPAPVAGIGIGVPSMIDQKHGRVVMSVNIPLENFDFRQHMAQETQLPVFIDNDANVAALAEVRTGAAAGASEVLMITIGTGIGGGIITGGKVYRGAIGSAAELGHMVIDVNGPRCQGNCPNYGCFETMASGTALRRYAVEAAAEAADSALGRAFREGRELDGALVYELASAGDEAAAAVLKKIGFYIGVGMTSLVNMFNPEFFVIGGGIMGAADFILPPALDYLSNRGLRPNRDIVRVVKAHYGDEAGTIGAGCLAWEELGNPVQA